MNDEQIWSAIDTQRLSVAAVLDGLTEDQWAQASLCAGWTVRDVAAHLTLQQVGLGEALAGVIRHPALGMNRMILQMARRQSALPTDELTARIRGMVGSRKPNVGTTCREALIDALVHGQDITVPLGIDLPMPVEPAAEAASRVWQTGWPWHARRAFAGFRLSATDMDWAVGEGRDIEGPIEAIVLTLTRRSVALPRLAGSGAAALQARLASTR